MCRIRSSIGGIFCSRFIVGVLIDGDDDDDDDKFDDVTVGRGIFEFDSDRNR